MKPATNKDDYLKAGSAFGMAWLTLADAFDVPPSFEVFAHELERANVGRTVTVTPPTYAVELAKRETERRRKLEERSG